jgi:hypothetical protein
MGGAGGAGGAGGVEPQPAKSPAIMAAPKVRAIDFVVIGSTQGLFNCFKLGE